MRIAATYMRGGTSKGVFFRAGDLPVDPKAREALLLRVIGSPDPYGKQLDGMGAATSSTSKVVILAPSARPDSDVDYTFGQVAIDRPLIDWSGNCGNLTAAVGPFALAQGWVRNAPRDGVATVRIWQANIGKRIVAHVPIRAGEVIEDGAFHLDGVTFPSAEIRIEFLDPGGLGDDGDAPGALFPTGRLRDTFTVDGKPVEATLINAGNPMVFVDARALGLGGTEPQAAMDGNGNLLAAAERIRAEAAVRMGLAESAHEATASRPHTPKIAFVTPPQAYAASSGKAIGASDIDVTLRMLSMGRAHHAITGTGAVAAAVACAVEGTTAHAAVRSGADPMATRIGHASGTITVGAEVARAGDDWTVARVVMSRSARRLMEGWVIVPGDGAPR